jgi:hypothetical protein
MRQEQKPLAKRIQYRLHQESYIWQNNQRILQLTRKVTANAKLNPEQPPVAFFNASTRLYGMSLNAAFSFLTACSLQLSGVPVVHFACRSGMSRCVLGTQRENPAVEPPCKRCIGQSRWLYANAPTLWFDYHPDEALRSVLHQLNVPDLSELIYAGRPLGELVLPGLRWVLRRHHLVDDEPTRFLLREYIFSAHNIAEEFERFLRQVEPQSVVVFNGMMFPEATARWVAHKHGIRVISHEVGLQPVTAFFTDGEATAYPIDIPDDFELSSEQEEQLDAYLEKRFQGKFSMAGVHFWPQMERLNESFLERAGKFRQIVPIFTNVIFDTSQAHANSVFPHMFAWLDQVHELIRNFPETFFVIRAHPDETRPGKESQESVNNWVLTSRVAELPNVAFIGSREYFSSYELVQRSKFVMVYNSSIGLEASLMGAAVLCAGKARYTQLETVFFPETVESYIETAEAFLGQGEILVPPEFMKNARRFLYYQLFKTSLPFDEFLEPFPAMPGFVKLRRFHWQRLLPSLSPTLNVVVEGIRQGRDFLLDDM